MARSPYIDEGIRLFNAGRYFLAHETWEEHWIEAPAEDRDFLQGLIHVATGFHHLERGNKKGAELQFGKALNRLSAYSGHRHGVDIEEVRAILQAARKSVAGSSAFQRPQLS